jgi:hypothetical protein
MSAQTFTRSPFIPTKRAGLKTCPACGHPDNCSITRDGAVLVCARTPSDRMARDGRWTHILRDDSQCQTAPPVTAQPVAPVTRVTAQRADRQLAHAVYTALLRSLSLLPAHREDLQRRGLSLQSIEREQFRSTPTDDEAQEIARDLGETCDLTGIAGFFRRGGVWQIVKAPSGFFVPVRDRAGLIQGLQVRKDYLRDEKDTRYQWLSSKNYPCGITSGAPCHIQHADRITATGTAIATEGALKAIVAGEYLAPDEGGIIALAGVSTFQDNFGAHLKTVWPNLHTVNVCFDADWLDKREVKHQLARLIRVLRSVSLTVNVRTWQHEKGLDDYLVSESYEVAEVA